MPPTLAFVLWLLFLFWLLCFDPAENSRRSFALWVPTIWMFIVGTRLPSQWLGVQLAAGANALEEGNPVDRTIFSTLMLLAIGILLLRSFKWSAFFSRNFVLILFLIFALVSVGWSDFPLVALKRWFRDIGIYLVVLVALSDPQPLEAVRTLFRRFFYLFVPLSVLLIKYYPQMGKQYDWWSGLGMFVGATTSKNMLGVGCLVSGIFFFWDTVTRWPERKKKRTRRIIQLNVAFIAMTLWLLNLAKSATSQVCLVIGCLVIALLHLKKIRNHPTFLKVLIPASFLVYLILAFGLNLNGNLASAVGRDPTLTDRTLIWKTVLGMHTNPLLGTGYESFWLGSRLDYITPIVGVVTEAHNGYLEVYLNSGLIGLSLVVAILIYGYRVIWQKFASSPVYRFAIHSPLDCRAILQYDRGSLPCQ